MPGYAKLFSSIVHSTIWREENHVRLVWITMLALADKNGIVEASVPGLSDISRVTMEQCEEALQKLAMPDPYSRSQDYEGRRVQAVDGGWLLLNYVKYRGMLSAERKREQGRIRQRRFREKRKRNAGVTRDAVTNADITCNAQSDPDPEADPDINSSLRSEFTKDLTLDLNNKTQGFLLAANVSSLDSKSKKKRGRPKKNKIEQKINGTPTWEAYSRAYEIRYGTKPVRNEQTNSLCLQLVKRLGPEEAPLVAAYYLSNRSSYHVGRGHSLKALVFECEKIRTEWATGHQITATKAREEDRLEKTRAGWQKIIDERGEPG